MTGACRSSLGDSPAPVHDGTTARGQASPPCSEPSGRMGISAWFSLFNFSWLRRCKTCGVRGSKCLCRRPSLALEHIFFLEERKNKFGARNFSHVSDTMMTSNSTMFTNSTMFNSSTNNGVGAGPPSNLSGSTVLMRGAGSFADSDVNPTDYYYQTAAPVPPSDTSDHSAELLTPRMAKQLETKNRQQRRSRRQRSVSNRSEAKVKTDMTPTALVRKGSGRMRSKARHGGDTSIRPPIKEVVTGEYILYSEENTPVSLPHRQQQQQLVPHRKRSRAQNNSALNAKMMERPQYKEEPGVSFQFYGRSGSGRGGPPPVQPNAMVASNRSLASSVSTNDSFMMGSSSISSMRASQYSDRVSLETNFGSLNPQNALGNTGGRFIESGYTPSIQEDEEVLQQLNGWLHASSVSTQDSFLMSR